MISSYVTGITLIEVPFWWDQTYESIAATIHTIRPDLLENPVTLPIPTFQEYQLMSKKRAKENRVY